MKEGVKAYLSVYLALTLGVLISLSLALIEGVRLNTLQLEATCVSDIGMDAVMAEYHRELFRRFNLLALDSSYGRRTAGVRNVAARLEHYVLQNTSGFGEERLGRIADVIYRDLLEMELCEVSIEGITAITDEEGAVFRRQAILALQDDLGITSAKEILEWFQTVKEYQLDTRDVEAEKKEVDQKIASYQGKEILIDEETEILDFEDPTVTLEQRKKTGILKQTMGEQALSEKKLNSSLLIRQRLKDGRAISGNRPERECDKSLGITEKIAFSEYVMRYMGCFLENKPGSALDYEVEYVISGKDADADNLKGVLYRLLALREAANATYLFSDKEKSGEAEMAALAISVVLLVPELKDVFKSALLLGWAYAESVYDLKVLLSGGKIALIKDKDTWHYSLSSILEDAWEEFWHGEQQNREEKGLTYQDYLRLLLLVTPEEDVTMRAMNLVEADIRQTEGNKTFRLDGCFVRLESQVSFESKYGYQTQCEVKKSY